jgi:cytochrome c-type biogenesis protein CcmH/NrfG
MTSQTDHITDADAMRTELLARLGLPEDATARDVDTLHRAAVALAENAPEAQREWALDHLAEIDAVQSLLAEVGLPADVAPVVAPTASRARRWLPWVVAAVVLGVGGAFGIHLLSNANSVPGITGAPDTTSGASASSAPVDQAKVSALMQKITTNPKDVTAYSDLTGLYFQAGDYKNAQTFATKVTELAPKDATGWLALGAAQFNLGDAKNAEKNWIKAAALDPKNAEVHYDLGFLYLSSSPADMTKVKAEWEKVIAIDPTSDIAKSVKTHLGSLASQSPSPAASK